MHLFHRFRRGNRESFSAPILLTGLTASENSKGIVQHHRTSGLYVFGETQVVNDNEDETEYTGVVMCVCARSAVLEAGLKASHVPGQHTIFLAQALHAFLK